MERVNSPICVRLFPVNKRREGNGREWKGMEGKEARKEKGLRTPFDQLGLINGVHGGVVDGDGKRERRRREILFERAVGSVGLCY